MFWNRSKQTKTANSIDLNNPDLQAKNIRPVIAPDFDYSQQKKADVEEFLEQKGFFIRQTNNDDFLSHSSLAVWQIGPMGKLIRQNILRWWMDNIGRLKNIVTLHEVNNDPNLFLKYPFYGSQNSLQIPFGISRVKKVNREFFKSRDFLLSNELSRQFSLEFFTRPDSTRSWLDSWKDYVQNMLHKVGFIEEKLLCLYETPATAGNSSGSYYYERHNIKFAFPFGYEDILQVSSRIDFDFQTISDLSQSEPLKIREGKKAEFPHIIEIKLDVEKLVLAIILNRFACARFEDKKNVSIVFSPLISPIKCVVYAANATPEMSEAATRMHTLLESKYKSLLETRGEIGKTINHYRQFGVPYIVMVNENTVTSGIYNLFDCESEEWLELSIDQVFSYVQKGVGI